MSRIVMCGVVLYRGVALCCVVSRCVVLYWIVWDCIVVPRFI